MCAKSVNNDLAARLGEVDFDTEAEAFFGDKNSGVVSAFLQNTESFEILVFMKTLALVEAFSGEGVIDFAGRAEGGSKNSDNAEHD